MCPPGGCCPRQVAEEFRAASSRAGAVALGRMFDAEAVAANGQEGQGNAGGPLANEMLEVD